MAGHAHCRRPSCSARNQPIKLFRAAVGVSVAGDPAKKNIGNLQFAPMLNIGLPDGWSVTFSRVRFGQ
jgi:hypothetical protein